jgi:hypothetical protein
MKTSSCVSFGFFRAGVGEGEDWVNLVGKDFLNYYAYYKGYNIKTPICNRDILGVSFRRGEASG